MNSVEEQGQSTLTMKQRRIVLLFVALATLILTVGSSFWFGEYESATGQGSNSPIAPTSPLTPTLSPTIVTGSVTPTATRSRRVANEVLVPKAGDAVSGSLPIIGTALVHSFRSYDIHLSPAGNQEWQWLTSSHEVVRDGILYYLDTTRFSDGYYDIRVRAIADRGDYDETFVKGIEIRNANPPTPTPYVDESGAFRPILPSATPVSTPTATATLESRVEGGRGIYAPQSNDILRGYVPMLATVNGDRFQPFERYEVAISPIGSENWNTLYTGNQQIWQNEIFLLDTRVVPDGNYDVRLRNVFGDGNYEEYFVRNLEFINYDIPGPGTNFSLPSSQRRIQLLGFSSPENGDAVAEVVDFRGTAVDPEFLRWEMYWSPVGAESWSFLVSDERPVANGSLARLDLSQLPHARYDFRLRIVRTDQNYDDYHIRNLFVTEPTPTPLQLPPTLAPTPTSTAAG